MSLCPCGSNIEFSTCCLPIINGDVKASSPEQLMRSRYSAYAKKISRYIFDSYEKISKKEQSLDDICSWANETQWLSLIINHTSSFEQDYSPSHPLPTVDFTAFYRHEKRFFRMRENSRFVLEDLHWRYVDADTAEHIELPTPSRNDLCICQSGKKFKRCCANK
ncbi:MAG: SEC-C domain-containing protein [Colwellia sp.]|nr:SEC-C domain-containing protein [Colwellia sp.]